MSEVFQKRGLLVRAQRVLLLVPVWVVAMLLLTWLTLNPGQARLLRSPAISLPLLVRNAVDPLAPSCEAKKNNRKFSAVEPWQQHKASPGAGGGSWWLHPLDRMYERLHPSIQNKRPGRPSFRRVFCLVSPSRILVPRLRLLARRFLFR